MQKTIEKNAIGKKRDNTTIPWQEFQDRDYFHDQDYYQPVWFLLNYLHFREAGRYRHTPFQLLAEILLIWCFVLDTQSNNLQRKITKFKLEKPCCHPLGSWAPVQEI